jgi:hypothetical protein
MAISEFRSTRRHADGPADAYASSRVTMAWETGTGRVMVTVSKSCFVLGGCVNALPVNQT